MIILVGRVGGVWRQLMLICLICWVLAQRSASSVRADIAASSCSHPAIVLQLHSFCNNPHTSEYKHEYKSSRSLASMSSPSDKTSALLLSDAACRIIIPNHTPPTSSPYLRCFCLLFLHYSTPTFTLNTAMA